MRLDWRQRASFALSPEGIGAGERGMAQTGWMIGGGLPRTGLGRIAAGIALVGAAAIGLAATVVFAAALAVTAVIAAILLMISSVVLRPRRRAPAHAQVIEARKVGHAWVAYGLDQRSR